MEKELWKNQSGVLCLGFANAFIIKFIIVRTGSDFMCLGVPGKIEKLTGTKGIISYGGAKREVDLSLIEDPQVGEYVIVHAGFAIEKLDEDEAKETLRLFEEIFSYSP